MDTEFTTNKAGAGTNAEGNVPNCVRNLSRNLYIKQIRIIVNSARGAIEKSADVDTGFIDAERLWQMTRENCNSKYFAEGGFRAWRDFGCAILLSSPQFAPGLQACDGVAYPVQIQIEMEVQNRAVDVSALAVCGGGTNTGALANTGGKACHRLQPDASLAFEPVSYQVVRAWRVINAELDFFFVSQRVLLPRRYQEKVESAARRAPP